MVYVQTRQYNVSLNRTQHYCHLHANSHCTRDIIIQHVHLVPHMTHKHDLHMAYQFKSQQDPKLYMQGIIILHAQCHLGMRVMYGLCFRFQLTPSLNPRSLQPHPQPCSQVTPSLTPRSLLTSFPGHSQPHSQFTLIPSSLSFPGHS